MQDIKEVIAKVQKLLALADGNTNENECRSARAAADRILQEYRLTMADVEAQAPANAEPFKRDTVSQGGRRLAWQETILSELCVHFGGAFYFNSYRSGGDGGRGGGKGGKGYQSYVVMAKESDFAIIHYMFTYLTRQVDRLCRWHCGGQGIKVATAWRLGCARGIASQFRDMRDALRAQQAQSAAMVLLDSRAAAAKVALDGVIKLKQGAMIGYISDAIAHNSGYAEGRKVEINQGLTTGRAAPALT